MFVPIWMIFLVTGLVMAVFAVTWGIRSRQFEDQQRARFLPLIGLNSAEVNRAAGENSHRADLGALWVLVIVGFGAILSGLFLALRHM